MQCVAVCCSVLQCVAGRFVSLFFNRRCSSIRRFLRSITDMCCSVLQCVAVRFVSLFFYCRCSVICRFLRSITDINHFCQTDVKVYFNVLQGVAGCCNMF